MGKVEDAKILDGMRKMVSMLGTSLVVVPLAAEAFLTEKLKEESPESFYTLLASLREILKASREFEASLAQVLNSRVFKEKISDSETE